MANLDDLRKTDPNALRERSVSGEDMSTDGYYPTDRDTVSVTLGEEKTKALGIQMMAKTAGAAMSAISTQAPMDNSFLNEEEYYDRTIKSDSEANALAGVYSAVQASNPEEMISLFNQIKEEYATSGVSETAEDIRSNVLVSESKQLTEDITSIMLTADLDQAGVDNLLEFYKEKSAEIDDLDVALIAAEEVANRGMNRQFLLNESVKTQRAILGSIYQTPTEKQAIKDLYYREVGSIDKDWVSAILDSTLSALPFYESFTIDNLVEEMTEAGLIDGVEGSLGLDFLTPGSALDFLKDKFMSLSGSERVEWATKTMALIKENAGYLGVNDVVKFNTLEAVFGEYVGEIEEDDTAFSNFLLDAFGFLDAAGVGIALKKFPQAIARSSVARAVAKGNPKLEKALVRQALKDPETAAAINATQGDLAAQYVYPKPIQVEVPILRADKNYARRQVEQSLEASESLLKSDLDELEAVNKEIASIKDELRGKGRVIDDLAGGVDENGLTADERMIVDAIQSLVEGDELSVQRAIKEIEEELLDEGAGSEVTAAVKAFVRAGKKLKYPEPKKGKYRRELESDLEDLERRKAGLEDDISYRQEVLNDDLTLLKQIEGGYIPEELLIETGEVRKISREVVGPPRPVNISDIKFAEQLSKELDDIFPRIIPHIDPTETRDIDDVTSEVLELMAQEASLPFREELKRNPLLLMEPKFREFAARNLNDLGKANYRSGMSVAHYNPDNNMLTTKSVYGKSDTQGFESIDAAKEDALARFGDFVPEENISFVSRQGEGTVTATEGASDVYYVVKQVNPVDKQHVDTAGMFLDDMAAIKSFPTLTTYLKTPDAYAKSMSDIGNRASDLTYGIQSRLLSVLDSSFSGLSGKSVRKVNHALRVGEDEERILGHDDLLALDFSPKEMNAYYRARRVSDAFWVIDNQKLRQGYLGKEFKYAEIEDIEFSAYGRPLGREEVSNVVEVYDPRQDAVLKLDADEIYNNGGVVLKTEVPHGTGYTKSTSVLLSKADNSRFTVRDLPSNVLPYREGHLTRYYNENFFVKGKTKVKIDGEERTIEVALGAATMRRDARAYRDQLLDRLRAEAVENGLDDIPYSDIEVVAARELSVDNLSRFRSDLRPVKGPRFSSRGQQLETIDELKAEIAEPIESLVRTAGSISREGIMDDTVQVMKEGWMSRYGEKFGQIDYKGERMFPVEESMIPKTAKFTDDEYANALASYRYITQNMEGYDNNRLWKSFMINIANWLDTKDSLPGNRSFARFLQENVGENGNPIKLARSAAFYMFLATNPIRQFVLQTQQFHFVASTNPALAANALGKTMGLNLGMVVSNNKTAMDALYEQVPNIHKALGYSSRKEWMDTVKAFKQSGLPFSISQHSFSRDAAHSLKNAVTQGTASRAVNKIARGATAPARAAKLAGFDFGEYNNLSLTWMFAREQFMKKAGRVPRNAQDWQEIGINARNMALGMTQAGNLTYQSKGIWPLFTQFLSIQHKALSAILPAGLGGSKAFTGGQKAAILTGQVLFWGIPTVMFGDQISELVNDARETLGIDLGPEGNQDLEMAVRHGLVEQLINTGVSVATGEDQNIAVEGFSPVDGQYETALTWSRALLQGENSPLELAPSFAAGGRLLRTTNVIQGILQTEEADTVEKATKALKASLLYTSGGANWLKQQAARRYNHLVSSGGAFLDHATDAEANAQLLGLVTRPVADMYEMKYKGRRPEFVQPPYAEVAGELFDRIKQRVILLGDDGDMSGVNQKILEEAIEEEAVVLSSVSDPNDRHEIIKSLRRRVLEDQTENGVDSFLEKTIQALWNGNYAGDTRSMAKDLQNSGLLDSEEQLQFFEEVMDYLNKGTILEDTQ